MLATIRSRILSTWSLIYTSIQNLVHMTINLHACKELINWTAKLLLNSLMLYMLFKQLVEERYLLGYGVMLFRVKRRFGGTYRLHIRGRKLIKIGTETGWLYFSETSAHFGLNTGSFISYPSLWKSQILQLFALITYDGNFVWDNLSVYSSLTCPGKCIS
jgi:hypothetical protein